MRKISTHVALAVLVIAATAPDLVHAEAMKRASQKEIPKLLEAATGRNSAYNAYLIGETKDRIYLEYMTGIHASSNFPNRPQRVVYWLPRYEVSDADLETFKRYKHQQMQGR
jgi:hypothetical protein